MTAQPLAPSYSPHPPTQELLEALRVHGWMVRLRHDTAGVAYLTNPATGDDMRVTIDYRNPDRIGEVAINGERKLIRRAIEFVRGEL